MKKNIGYLVTPEMEFFVFLREGRENIDAMISKEKELQEKYGTYQTQWGELPHVYRQFKELKQYYGTVWIAYKPENGTYIIADHYKVIEEDVKKRGYKLKKIVLEEYKPNYWKEGYEQNKLAKKTREGIKNADLTVLEDIQPIKRRSPGFD